MRILRELGLGDLVFGLLGVCEWVGVLSVAEGEVGDVTVWVS